MDTEETGSFAPRSNIAKSPVDSLYASQPDVVLSEERDSYYSDTLLGESFSELVETFLGSRRTTLLAPEMKALSSCLYYGLTSCIGEQFVVFLLYKLGMIRRFDPYENDTRVLMKHTRCYTCAPKYPLGSQQELVQLGRRKDQAILSPYPIFVSFNDAWSDLRGYL